MGFGHTDPTLTGMIMRIGWLIPTVGIFGAVREMVEVSNELVKHGHDVAIFHPTGEPCVWLPCLAETKRIEEINSSNLDALIGIIDWSTEMFSTLRDSQARLKAFCLMGFDPTEETAKALRGEIEPRNAGVGVIRQCIEENMVILADSDWQLEWVADQVGVEVGVPFGGINLQMFRYADRTERTGKEIIVGYSNDPRKRKGTDTVLKAIDLLKDTKKVKLSFESYWDKRFTQQQMVEFYQRVDIFVDGHHRGGWCNPVAEAMACGAAVVCTEIGATSGFAVPGITAITIPVGDEQAMAQGVLRLAADRDFRLDLVREARRQIEFFDYARVTNTLESFLRKKLG